MKKIKATTNVIAAKAKIILNWNSERTSFKFILLEIPIPTEPEINERRIGKNIKYALEIFFATIKIKSIKFSAWKSSKYKQNNLIQKRFPD